MSEKTERPTPRRLRKAREEGDSGASSFAAQSVAFVVAVALAPAATRALAAWADDAVHAAVQRAARPSSAVSFDPVALATAILVLALPLLAAAGVAGAIAQAVQTGGVLATRRLAPSLDRLNPVAGIGKLFSAQRLFAVARAFLAGAAVAWLANRALREHLVDIARVAGRPRWIAPALADAAGSLAWAAALVGLFLAVGDALVTRAAWLRRLRMTRDEVKREHRDAEGDPQVKAARERAYHELLAQASIATVRSATVVVVNPTHLACALRYKEAAGDDAPVVLATGEGDLAARIVRAAQDYGVPVVRDVPLARALAALEPGQAIPEALYEAVAEILREVLASPA